VNRFHKTYIIYDAQAINQRFRVSPGAQAILICILAIETARSGNIGRTPPPDKIVYTARPTVISPVTLHLLKYALIPA
jgi:hypothetical protein